MDDVVVELLPRWVQQRWAAHALCTGHTDLFFPPHAERPQTRARREAKAREICRSCTVIFECRRYARDHLEYGFWGGESEEERIAAGYELTAPIGGRHNRKLG